MAKRFTDSAKWERPWFSELGVKEKLTWMYLLDRCDHRGVWFGNFRLMSYELGFKVTRDDLMNWFGDKIQPLQDKFFIRSFVDFQYGELNPNNNAHKTVIKLLENLGASEELKSPSEGAQDKDKDKENIKGGVGEKLDYESLYKIYPLKRGKQKGIDKCRAQIKTREDFENLKTAIDNYKLDIVKQGTDPKYIKHFSTFMGLWREYLDPDIGHCSVSTARSGPTPIEEILKRGNG